MGHLGDGVAGYVDGQLSGDDNADARRHLADCEMCRHAVLQEENLKARMRTVADPAPPAALLESLCGLPSARISRESLWSKLCRSQKIRISAGMVGASVTVIAAAWIFGGSTDQIGDEVSPPFGTYAAAFSTTPAAQIETVMTSNTLSELDQSGWPCREVLDGDLLLMDGRWIDHRETVALSYADSEGLTKLELFEQNGAIDPDSVGGFSSRTVNDATVWIRTGAPTIATWDHDGIVYTAVTNAEPERITQIVAQLPHGDQVTSPTKRLGNGFDKMTSWISDAA